MCVAEASRSMQRAAWIVWAAWVVSVKAGAGADDSGAAEYLLPHSVLPYQYRLKLLYSLQRQLNYPYYGVVDIQLKALEPTSKIILHAQDLSVAKDKVLMRGGPDDLQVSSVELNDTYNFLTLSLNQDLEKDTNYTLTIPFYGNLQPGLDGVYISSYFNNKTNTTEELIATQFEATSARKGFPCFDEPRLKAEFLVALGHARDLRAIANMPINYTTTNNELEPHWSWQEINERFKEEQSEYVWDYFQQSVPMSTYLVAFLVSRLQSVDSPPNLSTTPFKIWAREDAIDQTNYAASIGPKVLSYFEEWFGIDFPLPKQDMAAVPDFAAGAMENWGLVTYRETALLYHPNLSSLMDKERVAEVIAHELAHQWFGNLVTMAWWSDLWLNEGFATHMASMGVGAVEPKWRAPEAHAADNALAVLELDALASSHPVSVPIDDPKRIAEIFDNISYLKGAALIRMMTMFLGEKVFRDGITRYLKKYSYSNAAREDLWRELQAEADAQTDAGAVAGAEVAAVLDSWTTQTGYPLLTVTRDYAEGTCILSQKRYLSVEMESADNDTASWWVPLDIVEEGQEANARVQWLKPARVLEPAAEGQTIPCGANDTQWVLFNANMMAPYRVNYDERNWQLLASALAKDPSALPVLGRVQLLSDAFALAWAGRLDYSHAIRLASYLKHENELPLQAGLGALRRIEGVLRRCPEYAALQRFMRELVGGAYAKGGLATQRLVDPENLYAVKMQVEVSAAACRAEVRGCEDNALELFRRWMATPDPDENNPIPPELRRTVYCAGVARGRAAEWRWALERMRRARGAAARESLLRALACSREPWLINQYLEWVVADSGEVRRQDAASVLVSLLRAPVGFYPARDFVYHRIHDIHKAFKGQSRRLGGVLKALLDQLTTQRELDEFLTWKSGHEKYLEEAQLGLAQGVERARGNLRWLRDHRHTLVGLLRASDHA